MVESLSLKDKYIQSFGENFKQHVERLQTAGVTYLPNLVNAEDL